MNRAFIPRSLLRSNPCQLGRPLAATILSPLLPTSPLPAAARTFTATSFLAKKGGAKKSKHEEASVDNSSPLPEKKDARAVDFEAEFEKLESEIARIGDKLKNDLSNLRAGQADPALLEGLSVVVNKAAGSTVLMRDVAHVVTRGRALVVTVYEAASVKGIVSAIQLANLSLQPVLDPNNPLLVTVPLPPPTKESRDKNSKKAFSTGQKALDTLKDARLVTHKKVMSVRRTVRPDDFRKADKRLEEIVKKGRAELEAVIAATRKKIEQD